jgi:hypothetical protein
MQARRKMLVVKSYKEQKETHEVTLENGETLRLYIGRKYGENNREMNPVVCEVLSVGKDVDNIEVGDMLILHHNCLDNEALIIERDLNELSDIVAVFWDKTIYAKIDKQTGELTPINGNVIAERITKKFKTNLEIPNFNYTEEYEFNVVKVSDDFTEVKDGDRILCYKHSDYEMVYHFKNVERRAIRISKEDIIAVIN